MIDEAELHPEVTRDHDRVMYRSKIEFKPAPGAEGLLKRLRANAQKQIIWDDEDCEHPELRAIFERGECYPSPDRDDCAILDLYYLGPRVREHIVRMRHNFMVPAQIRVLLGLGGYARLL